MAGFRRCVEISILDCRCTNIVDSSLTFSYLIYAAGFSLCLYSRGVCFICTYVYTSSSVLWIAPPPKCCNISTCIEYTCMCLSNGYVSNLENLLVRTKRRPELVDHASCWRSILSESRRQHCSAYYGRFLRWPNTS